LIKPSDPTVYYKHLLTIATNYDQWAEAATILDQLEGNNVVSRFYYLPHSSPLF